MFILENIVADVDYSKTLITLFPWNKTIEQKN